MKVSIDIPHHLMWPLLSVLQKFETEHPSEKVIILVSKDTSSILEMEKSLVGKEYAGGIGLWDKRTGEVTNFTPEPKQD